MMDTKIKALSVELDVNTDEINVSRYDDDTFEVEGMEYIVLTEEEADEKVEGYIKETLWAFNSSFLSCITKFDTSIFEALQPQCENSNDAILSLVEGSCGFDELIEEAVSCDGRGHFLSGYDGEELELENDLLAYRTN